MKESKDPSDPFSPLFEHQMHTERLAREWEASRHSLADFSRMWIQCKTLVRLVISKATNIFISVRSIWNKPFVKVKIK